MIDSFSYLMAGLTFTGIAIMLASWRSEIPEKCKQAWLVDYLTDHPHRKWSVIVPVQAETKEAATWVAHDRLARNGRKPIKVISVRRAK